MNLRMTLLASAAILITGQALASDITSPFYLPEAGKFLSDTSIEYSTFKHNQPKIISLESDGWYAKEKISYGINDNFSVNAAIGNTFDNKYASLQSEDVTHNNSHNFDYTIGAAYNYTTQRVLSQFYASYNTFQPKSFFEDSTPSDNWNKYVTLGAKVGYALGCDDFIPYIDFKATYGLSTVDYTSEFYGKNTPPSSHWTYSTFAGAHKMWEVVSADLGVRWDNVRHDIHTGSDKKSRNDVYAQGSINYFIANDTTIGLYGDYLIGDTHMADIKDDYTIGANFKIGF